MTPFRDLHDYVAIPELTALRLSPDGTWLAAVVQTVNAEGKKFVSSIWRIDASPAGSGSPPARLTRSAEGEGSPAFLPDGSLLFISRREGPAAGPGADGEPARDKAALWLLPAGGGEASRIAAPPGGVAGVAAARDARSAIFTSPVLPGTSGGAQDAARRKARKDAGVTAILHEAGPVRYWDHDLGPDSLRLQAAVIGDPGADAAAGGHAPPAAEPRDLTPDPGRALDDSHFELTPDGSLAVAGWSVTDDAAAITEEVTVITVATGERRTLLSAPGYDFGDPRISPDGRLVACLRVAHDSYQSPGDVTLVVAALHGGTSSGGTSSGEVSSGGTSSGGTSSGEVSSGGAGSGTGVTGGGPRDLLAGLDRRPLEAAWAPDSASVYFTADDNGRRPVFRVDVATAEITRITSDDAAYGSLCPAPDGRWVYALRAAIDEPPAPVRLDVTAAGRDPARLAGPAERPGLPGTVTEVQTVAADGATVRGWLVLPAGASAGSPAPLLLWVHGGPVMSWNSWSWRWNPWLMAARGYAVLLPDPALSTGYGHDFIARGHGRWGEAPFTDVMAITDAVVARPDIDAARTAMMGGSFGGYMANWIAGHTDRFSAIVSHAGLWALDQMFATTDLPSFWRRHFGDPLTQPGRYLENSPNLHVAAIRTPMLVIHGDKDYRVPVGEALRLWADLAGRPADAKFLYFPDENHWILTPGHVIVWYETVLAFLAQHVLGEPWRRPDLL